MNSIEKKLLETVEKLQPSKAVGVSMAMQMDFNTCLAMLQSAREAGKLMLDASGRYRIAKDSTLTVSKAIDFKTAPIADSTIVKKSPVKPKIKPEAKKVTLKKGAVKAAAEQADPKIESVDIAKLEHESHDDNRDANDSGCSVPYLARADVINTSLSKLEKALTTEPVTVTDKSLKIQVLERLSALLDSSIADVLDDIRDDILRIEDAA